MSAGEIDVSNGRVVYIDSCSGHYTPTQHSLLFAINYLATLGAQGIPSHGLRLNQLTRMNISSNGLETAKNIRAGTGNCYSYVPPS